MLPALTIRRASAAMLTAAVMLSGASFAVAQPNSPARPQPTPAAKRAGISPGNAYLGWRNKPVHSMTSSGLTTTTTTTATSGVQGLDVASYQGDVDWNYWNAKGKRFAYVKATEGTSYRNPYFGSQYRGSYDAGLIRGAYHFAAPGNASGAAQADYFVRYGGSWSRDGRTLPGVLDVEYNPYGATCYGLTQAQMVSWIKSFTTRYKYRTSRDAVLYTTLDWWTKCTGNSTSFNQTNPLWKARYASTPGTLPGNWPFHTFWQYTSSPLDQDRFSANYTRLVALANG